jgi:hypothetical protein
MKNTLLLAIVLLVLTFGLALGSNMLLGINGFGPTQIQEVTVKRLYVDISGSKDNTASHYMVSTDKGIFEVSNLMWFGIFNADEIYGQLQEGKSFTVKTKGNKLVNFIFQQYPYIISVKAK